MYKYYQECYSEEHMLYASEIALVYGIMSESGKPHSALVAIAIKDYLDEVDLIFPQLFYYGKGVMRKIHPSCLYSKAIERMLNKSINCVYTSNSGKKFKFNKK